ncbi:MAG: hypothetical protein HY655_13025 [Acidobacteria bacterium]|nr:hypothetical protein [Acidobacteriota bacterium]
MTLDEFGALVKRNPKVRDYYTADELDSVPAHVLAQKVLAAFPEYWDMISPSARRIYELQRANTASQAVFATEGMRIEHRAGHIANNLAEAQAVHEMDMLIEASSRNIPRDVWGAMLLTDHQFQLQVKLERDRLNNEIELESRRRNIGLDGADRADLTPFYYLEEIRRRLTSLYDERDAVLNDGRLSDVNKRDRLADIDNMIEMLREDLSARGQQTLVQAADRPRLGQGDPDPNGGTDKWPKA